MIPGDKSLAHRALLLAALARTPSHLRGLPDGDDVARTIACLRALGTGIEDGWRVTPHSWRAPSSALDCGDSATLARLLMGALAGARVPAALVGGSSLSSRPMARVAGPLRALFGADVVLLSARGTLPARVTAPPGPSVERAALVETGVASAQVKSAVLLAALRTSGVTVREPAPTRDHTERMLAALGVDVRTAGCTVELRGPCAWDGFDVEIPGDPSSAAFVLALAAGTGRALSLAGLLLNPRRLGFATVLGRMGARLRVVARETRLGEPVGEVSLEPAALAGVDVEAALAPDLIDEVPALVAAALLARGPTVLRGLGELRHKESDRLLRLVDLARAFGGRAQVDGDTLAVEAGARARGRVSVRTDGDHRLAMAARVLGRAFEVDVDVDAPGCEQKSFPGFAAALDALLP